jgi:nitrogen fixation-related uncharacterized protein
MSQASESGFRAAITSNTAISVGLVGTLLGFAFWMGVQHNQLASLNADIKSMLKDHEERIRVLERKP